jgi:GT2 family glycosyltransferase
MKYLQNLMGEKLPSTNPKVSVIIANYNGACFLEKLFSSLENQTFMDFEVIFVENASSDNSLELVESIAGRSPLSISIVKPLSNTGFCRGNNIGYKHSKGKYIVLLNNDTYVLPEWLEQLVNTMDQNPSIGICQSKIIDVNNKLIKYGCFLGVYGKRKFSEPFQIVDGILEGAFYAAGTALIIRRELIENSGYLFDGKQFTGDMDLSWRIRLMGFKVVTNVRSICYHFQGHSSRIVLRNQLKISFVVSKDTIRTVIENYSSERFFRRSPLFFTFMLLLAIYDSLKFQTPCIFSLAKAVVWNISLFKDTWTKHLRVQAMRKISDKEIEKSMLPYPSELYFLKLKLSSQNNL